MANAVPLHWSQRSSSTSNALYPVTRLDRYGSVRKGQHSSSVKQPVAWRYRFGSPPHSISCLRLLGISTSPPPLALDGIASVHVLEYPISVSSLSPTIFSHLYMFIFRTYTLARRRRYPFTFTSFHALSLLCWQRTKFCIWFSFVRFQISLCGFLRFVFLSVFLAYYANGF